MSALSIQNIIPFTLFQSAPLLSITYIFYQNFSQLLANFMGSGLTYWLLTWTSKLTKLPFTKLIPGT